MATTPNLGLHYPALTDAPNGPVQIQQLATDIDNLGLGLGFLVGVSGPSAQTDYSSNATVVSTTFTVVSGRRYLVNAHITGTQVTAPGNASSTILIAGAEPDTGAARLLSHQVSATGAASVGSNWADYLAPSSGSVTFSVTASSDAGAYRVGANQCRLILLDIGT